jgi:hypothetical protein
MGVRIAQTQRIEGCRKRVDPGLQRFDVRCGGFAFAGVDARDLTLDGGLEPVRHFSEQHRAGQPGATLEGMQGAHAAGRQSDIIGALQPVAQTGGQLWQQLLALFFEDRE